MEGFPVGAELENAAVVAELVTVEVVAELQKSCDENISVAVGPEIDNVAILAELVIVSVVAEHESAICVSELPVGSEKSARKKKVNRCDSGDKSCDEVGTELENVAVVAELASGKSCDENIAEHNNANRQSEWLVVQRSRPGKKDNVMNMNGLDPEYVPKDSEKENDSSGDDFENSWKSERLKKSQRTKRRKLYGKNDQKIVRVVEQLVCPVPIIIAVDHLLIALIT